MDPGAFPLAPSAGSRLVVVSDGSAGGALDALPATALRCASVPEALGLLPEAEPDAILLDLSGGADVETTVALVRRAAAHAGVVAVVPPGARIAALEAGADAALEPADAPLIAAALAAVAASRLAPPADRVTAARRAAVVGTLSDGVFATDETLAVVEVNEAFCRIVGLPSAEVVGASPPFPWLTKERGARRRFDALVRRVRERRTATGELRIHRPDGSIRDVAVTLAQAVDPETGAFAGIGGTFRDVTALRAAELEQRRLHLEADAARRRAEAEADRSRALAETALCLVPPLTRSELAVTVLEQSDRLIPSDSAAFVLLDRSDGMAVVLAGRGARRQPFRSSERYPLDTALPGVLALATGELVVAESVEEVARRFPQLAEIAGVRGSVAAVPVVLDGRPAASIVLTYAGERTFEPWHLDTLRALAVQCGQALARTELFEKKQLEQRRTALGVTRTRRLQRLTQQLAEPRTSRHTSDVLVSEARRAADADRARLFLTDEATGRLRLVAATPRHESSPESFRATDLLSIETSLRRREVTIASDPALLDQIGHPADRAVAILPLFGDRGVRGVLLLGLGVAPTPEDGELVRFLSLVATQAALALDRARLLEAERRARERAEVLAAREHEIARELQRALLPSHLLSTEQVSVAARYRTAHEHLDVGGDWFDVVALSDGRVGLAVGDVLGDGVRSAAVMGQLRSALGALAPACSGPAEVLARLDRFAESVEHADCTTVCYADLDPANRLLRYGVAGHPPPLLVAPDGTVTVLEGGRSGPLLGLIRAPVEAEVAVEPGSRIVLYTDGLIERRGHALDEGLERLSATLHEAHGRTLDDLADHVLETMTSFGRVEDDIALLCVEVAGELVGRLQLRLAAQPEELARLRSALRTFCERERLPAELTHDLLLATGELVANVIEHAYEGRRGDVVVSVELPEDGTRSVVVRVSDRGGWRDRTSGGDRGRGLSVARAVMDEIAIASSGEGTSITMRRILDGTIPR